MNAVTGIRPTKQGPQNWLCQAAGAAAPSGGRELHDSRANVGAQLWTSRFALAIDIKIPTASPSVTIAVPP